jgi:poly-beta-1,6-N-acetyl-D-glucosamine synthase
MLVLFLAASGIFLYVAAGYPLLLACLARRNARPVRREPIEPHISIIIAVFNGEQHLKQKLDSVLALDYPREKTEILVASDGSTDRTSQIADSYAERGVRLLRLPRAGKPAALNAAIPQASGEILILTDVRQRLAPDSVRRLVACFADPSVGVVSGELVIGPGVRQEEAVIGLYWRFETWIRDRLSAIDSMFGATGPFYAIRRELAGPLPPEILLDDMYLPLAAFFKGYRLVMESSARAYDYPTSLETEFRRKVRTLAGNYQLLRFFPQLLGTANRMWLHFVSYKIGRLLLPWALMAILISSFFLPPALRGPVLAVQGVFYAMALLDRYIPEASRLKRWTSAERTFVVVMIAAIAGFSVFFVPPQRLWKVTSASTEPPMTRG